MRRAGSCHAKGMTCLRQRRTFTLLLALTTTLYISIILHLRAFRLKDRSFPGQMYDNSSENDSKIVISYKRTAPVVKLRFANDSGLFCKFPLLDPLDPSILPYVDKPPIAKCKQTQPDLSIVDSSGFLRINEAELDTGVTCLYRLLDPYQEPNVVRPRLDEETEDGADEMFTDPIMDVMYPQFPLNMGGSRHYDTSFSFSPLLAGEAINLNLNASNTAEVFCFKNGSSKELYHNIHPIPSQTFLNDQQHSPDEDHLSALLFFQDSVSRSAFQRELPQTYHYITEGLGTFILEGYNKVADNTRPNMMPLLTGKRHGKQGPGLNDELANYIEMGFYDEAPLIWNNFSDSGYAVAFIEDEPQLGLLHLDQNGFLNDPVKIHHYMYPYFRLRQLHQYYADQEDDHCFRNSRKYKQSLDLIEQTVKLYHRKNKRYFMYSFLSELSHNKGNLLSTSDSIVLQMLKNITPLLNNTVLIVASDHGLRTGNIRETLVGLLEERLPILSIRFPDWFYAKHPHIREALQTNKRRLSTPFDVYETLMDILRSHYNDQQRPHTARGFSQLYPIPANRTCKSAEVPQHYCTCSRSRIVTNEILGRKLGIAIIDHLNELLHKHTECVLLRLLDVKRVEQLYFPRGLETGAITHKEARNVTVELDVVTYRVLVSAEPSKAFFEATMHLSRSSSAIRIPNAVSRTNLYGNQSSCITDPILKPYCFCAQ